MNQHPLQLKHYRGIGVRIQPSNQSVSFRVDVSFPLDGFLVHWLTVDVQGHQFLLNANHHFVPFGVEENGEAWKRDGLEVSFHSGEKKTPAPAGLH